MASRSLVDTRGATLAEGDLNGSVAVGFRRFDLRHTIVRHVNHSNRN